MEKSTWLLVANASKARLYSLCKARLMQTADSNDLKLEEECEHDESRMKGKDLISDKLGSNGHGTFVEAMDPKQHEAERFAIELNEKLNTARKGNHYRELIIAAPPGFLGILRKHMHNDTSKLIFKTIEKDYTAHEGKDLVTALEEHL